MALPDTAEYWQRPERFPTTLKKGICDCQQPLRLRAKPQSRHCERCKRFIEDKPDHTT